MAAADDSDLQDHPAQGRSRRDRPAKPPLSEEAVVDAAMEILKSEGLEAVTMRRVANALDTGAASLYVYVSGREALLAAILDRAIAAIELEAPDPSRWREQVHTLLRRMFEVLVAHPGIASLTLGGPPSGENVLVVPENMLGILLAGELDPQDAAWCCDILGLLVTGAALEEEVRRREAGSDPQDWAGFVEDMRSTFSGLPVERFPLISRYADEMVAGDSDDRFRFGIDVVLDGAIARARK